jgi:hypothetical protein
MWLRDRRKQGKKASSPKSKKKSNEKSNGRIDHLGKKKKSAGG